MNRMYTPNIIITTAWFLLIGGILASFYLVLINSESMNLAVAFSVMVGAMVLFGLNTWFELREIICINSIQAQYSIDHSKPEISQYHYPTTSVLRAVTEIDASKYLASKNSTLFKTSAIKITKDMLIYSTVAFFLAEESDWQRTTKTYAAFQKSSSSARREDTKNSIFIPKEHLQKMLMETENIFAKAPFKVSLSKGLFWPPKSTIKISNDKIEIMNPFCSILITPDDSGSIYYTTPGSKVAHSPRLKDGSPKFETRYINLDIKITYSALRANDKNMPRYKSWCNNIISNAEEWFAPPPLNE